MTDEWQSLSHRFAVSGTRGTSRCGVATKWWTVEGAAEDSNSEEGGTMVA